MQAALEAIAGEACTGASWHGATGLAAKHGLTLPPSLHAVASARTGIDPRTLEPLELVVPHQKRSENHRSRPRKPTGQTLPRKIDPIKVPAPRPARPPHAARAAPRDSREQPTSPADRRRKMWTVAALTPSSSCRRFWGLRTTR